MDDGPDFEHVVGKQYGGMEATMGQEAYQANVKHVEAQTKALYQHMELVKMRAGARGIVFIVVILMAIPALTAANIALWKWVL